MSKKVFFALFFICTLANRGWAQFNQSVGVTGSAMFNHMYVSSDYEPVVFTVREFTYFPRYNIWEGAVSSISLGAPVGVGLGSVNQQFGSSLYYTVDLPAVLDLNFGYKSATNCESHNGAYVGAGFDYRYSSWKYVFDGSGLAVRNNSYGPVFRGGLRFGFPRTDMGLTVGIYYKVGKEALKYKTLGLNILLDL